MIPLAQFDPRASDRLFFHGVVPLSVHGPDRVIGSALGGLRTPEFSCPLLGVEKFEKKTQTGLYSLDLGQLSQACGVVPHREPLSDGEFLLAPSNTYDSPDKQKKGTVAARYFSGSALAGIYQEPAVFALPERRAQGRLFFFFFFFFSFFFFFFFFFFFPL